MFRFADVALQLHAVLLYRSPAPEPHWMLESASLCVAVKCDVVHDSRLMESCFPSCAGVVAVGLPCAPVNAEHACI
jgi:hypothetical protein